MKLGAIDFSRTPYEEISPGCSVRSWLALPRETGLRQAPSKYTDQSSALAICTGSPGVTGSVVEVVPVGKLVHFLTRLQLSNSWNLRVNYSKDGSDTVPRGSGLTAPQVVSVVSQLGPSTSSTLSSFGIHFHTRDYRENVSVNRNDYNRHRKGIARA